MPFYIKMCIIIKVMITQLDGFVSVFVFCFYFRFLEDKWVLCLLGCIFSFFFYHFMSECAKKLVRMC